MSVQSFNEILQTRAAHDAAQQVYGQWGDLDVHSWLDYGELDRRARAIGETLARLDAAGERALLLYPPGFEYIKAFFGCLYAGVVAVPAYPPDPARLDRTLPRLQAIIADAQATVVLTTGEIAGLFESVAAHAAGLAGLRWVATDTLPDATGFEPIAAGRDTLAFLQYTSGSTGTPKGVMVTHGNLLHNSAAIQRALGSTPETVKVSWVPPYHDMGLIGCILQAAYVGFPLVMMSPTAFLMRPLRWLQAISKTGAAISGAPNFAYDLCVQKVTREQRAKLDLSRWESAYVSAEPVRRETLERFAAAFAECGFRKEAFYPCYGLAEGTLVVAGGARGSGFRAVQLDDPRASTAEVVGVGPCIAGDGEIAIVDPETRERCAPGSVGEIWCRSESVAAGYWNRAKETEAAFQAFTTDGAGPFLRTGDLGLLDGGELFVTGRLKEVIIVRGRKHFPSDLEATIEKTTFGSSHYRAGGSAAFSVVVDGTERLYVAVEIERRQRERRSAQAMADERRRGNDRRRRPFAYKDAAEPHEYTADDVIRAIRRSIATEHGVETTGVILLRPGSVPKTSSGKKQRVACRALFLDGAGAADVLQRWEDRPVVLEAKPKLRIA